MNDLRNTTTTTTVVVKAYRGVTNFKSMKHNEAAPPDANQNRREQHAACFLEATCQSSSSSTTSSSTCVGNNHHHRVTASPPPPDVIGKEGKEDGIGHPSAGRTTAVDRGVPRGPFARHEARTRPNSAAKDSGRSLNLHNLKTPASDGFETIPPNVAACRGGGRSVVSHDASDAVALLLLAASATMDRPNLTQIRGAKG